LKTTSEKINQNLKKMTMTKFSTLTKSIFLTLAAAMMIFSFSSCATKTTFLTSSIVPAAEGSVKVKKDGNNNYAIKLQLSNLAAPGRLTPPKNFYLVWMVTDDDITKNMGQIISSTSFLSKRLTGSFETVSSFKPKKIFITAEDDATIQHPFSEVVFTTAFF
jgi:cell division protein FtsL